MPLRSPPPLALLTWRQNETKMADGRIREVVISSEFSAKLVKWHVRDGKEVREGSLLGFYEKLDGSESAESFIRQPRLKSSYNGRIQKLLVAEGDVVAAR